MSRSWIYLFAIAALAPVPAIAQTASAGPSDADRALAEKMLGAGGRVTPDKTHNECANPTRQNEIVVCAPDQDQFRMPSTADSDPTSDQALKDGRLHTPDVAGGGIFKGKATATFGSVEQPYIIDLSTIPMAPAGSDADKIAKGEIRAPR
ncbi:hypothetical protein [Novosphingobium sp. P6W]|uniref:hypothetical protein n=1 Tax=Novosphingobium sp. P6W TaxID=1609758 RepID=UPI000B117E56|nr:hypothetical protein [Novosphingobium sp. P6W]